MLVGEFCSREVVMMEVESVKILQSHAQPSCGQSGDY